MRAATKRFAGCEWTNTPYLRGSTGRRKDPKMARSVYLYIRADSQADAAATSRTSLDCKVLLDRHHIFS